MKIVFVIRVCSEANKIIQIITFHFSERNVELVCCLLYYSGTRERVKTTYNYVSLC